MKIASVIFRSVLLATVTATGVAFGAALAQQQGPPLPPDTLFEIGPVAKETVIGCKTEVRDVRNAISTKLSGIHETSRLVLRKGAKMSFRGNCKIEIAHNTLLLLEPGAQLILKSGSSASLMTNCTVPAQQIFIVDEKKVLRSVGGAPTLYSSEGPKVEKPLVALGH